MNQRLVVIAVFLALTSGEVLAEQTTPRFEVASIKPQAPGPIAFSEIPRAIPQNRPGGVFNPIHITLKTLILFAYDLMSYQLIGGPDWVVTDQFEVDARAGGDVSNEQLKLMVRTLLSERFQLTMHKEQRTMAFQALVHARPDKTLGPGLIKMNECNGATARRLQQEDPVRYPFPSGPTKAGCSQNGLRVLVDLLAPRLREIVMDATGLTGDFYFTIRFREPTEQPLASEAGDPSIPSLPVALSQQLGLKLESRRGPVDVLVIDSVQLPSAN
jgi:uncharacterized protein (TIGR03435 family)